MRVRASETRKRDKPQRRQGRLVIRKFPAELFTVLTNDPLITSTTHEVDPCLTATPVERVTLMKFPFRFKISLVNRWEADSVGKKKEKERKKNASTLEKGAGGLPAPKIPNPTNENLENEIWEIQSRSSDELCAPIVNSQGTDRIYVSSFFLPSSFGVRGLSLLDINDQRIG